MVAVFLDPWASSFLVGPAFKLASQHRRNGFHPPTWPGEQGTN
jgi:hypothetical protein